MDKWRMKSLESGEVTAESAESIIREPSFLEKVENRIYFYSEIDRDRVLQLNKSIRETNNHLLWQQKLYSLDTPPGIFLHINSYGGSIFAGMSAVDEILKSIVPVTTIVDGCCASAATLISVTGKRRLINRHAFMLIHQLSSAFWGKYAEFQDEMNNCDKLMEIIKSIYSEHTKIPNKELDKILKHDLWWDAATCKKFGLVDEII